MIKKKKKYSLRWSIVIIVTTQSHAEFSYNCIYDIISPFKPHRCINGGAKNKK